MLSAKKIMSQVNLKKSEAEEHVPSDHASKHMMLPTSCARNMLRDPPRTIYHISCVHRTSLRDIPTQQFNNIRKYTRDHHILLTIFDQRQ